jgi:hypothetical protein
VAEVPEFYTKHRDKNSCLGIKSTFIDKTSSTVDMEIKIFVWGSNQLLSIKILRAADNFVCTLFKGRNGVGARYSRSLEPPGHKGIVVDTTMIL